MVISRSIRAGHELMDDAPAAWRRRPAARGSSVLVTMHSPRLRSTSTLSRAFACSRRPAASSPLLHHRGCIRHRGSTRCSNRQAGHVSSPRRARRRVANLPRPGGRLLPRLWMRAPLAAGTARTVMAAPMVPYPPASTLSSALASGRSTAT